MYHFTHQSLIALRMHPVCFMVGHILIMHFRDGQEACLNEYEAQLARTLYKKEHVMS